MKESALGKFVEKVSEAVKLSSRLPDLKGHLLSSKVLWGSLVAALSSLPFLVYTVGDFSPPWDFWGSYLTSAHSWWALGDFFNPPRYFPQLFGGFPAYLDVQSSSWYLPVSFFTLDGVYAPSDAAALQGLTIIFGCMGVFALARHLGLKDQFAALAAIGFLFNPGFFGNAQHVDIVRAWALFPWILLALSLRKRPTATVFVLSASLWFQFFVGAYPGNIAAFAYLCLAWVAANAIWFRRKSLVPLAWASAAAGVGILMSLLKWLPYTLGSGNKNLSSNVLETNFSSLATLIYPFGGDWLPNDVTMRSYFIISIFVLAIFFVRKVNFASTALILVLFVSIVLSIDVVGAPHWQESLPLLDLSRFRTADFKPGISLSVIILGAFGLQSLANGKFLSSSRLGFLVRLILASTCVMFFYSFGDLYNMAPSDANVGRISLTASAIFLALLLTTPRLLRSRGGEKTYTAAVSVIGVVLIGASGLSWTASTSNVWLSPRSATAEVLWGMSESSSISNGETVWEGGRPALVGPELPTTPGELVSVGWNKSSYLGKPSFGGYVNLKGQPQFDLLLKSATTPGEEGWLQQLARPTEIWESTLGQTGVANCSNLEPCALSSITLGKWQPGEISFEIVSKNKTRAVINEVYYEGWFASECKNGVCESAKTPVSNENNFISFPVKQGVHDYRLEFRTPGIDLAWVAFYSALVCMVLSIFILSHLRKTDQGNLQI